MTGRLFDEFQRVVDAYGERAALDRFFAGRAEFLVPARAAHGELQASALDRWAEAFDWLDLLILSSAEVARHHEERVLATAGTEDSDVTALHHIFWSGQTVTGEVLALLRAGYSTGALARWRALHETATRAEFIVHACEKSAEAARRYLRHEEYRHRRELAVFQGWIRKVDPAQAIPREAMQVMTAEDDEAIDDHGEIFRTEYGWAHEELLGTSPEYADLWEHGRRMRGPVFSDLERVLRHIKEERLRFEFLYAKASAAVHGSPRSFVRFGEEGEAVLYDGPDLEALALSPAGEATARRLSDLTWVTVMAGDNREDDEDTVEADFRLVETIMDIEDRVEAAFAYDATSSG